MVGISLVRVRGWDRDAATSGRSGLVVSFTQKSTCSSIRSLLPVLACPSDADAANGLLCDLRDILCYPIIISRVQCSCILGYIGGMWWRKVPTRRSTTSHGRMGSCNQQHQHVWPTRLVCGNYWKDSKLDDASMALGHLYQLQMLL